MVGYSKWSKVKQIRGPLEVQRGAACGKLVTEITVAARFGDGGRSGNPRLRPVLRTSGTIPVLVGHVEHAIDRGSGEMREHITKKPFTKPAHPAAALHLYELPENHDDARNAHSHLAIPEKAPVRRAA